MPDIPPPPPGFKLDTPAPPPGYKLDDPPTGPSVFETTPQKLKRIGKGLASFVAGTAVPIAIGAAAGALVGPEVSEPVAAGTRLAGQAIGGALTPYAEYVTQRLMGEHPDMPTLKDAAKSAAWNTAFAALGEVGGKVTSSVQTEESVRAELEKLPAAERTTAKIKQIRQALETRTQEQAAETAKVTAQDFRNRDFWKAQGLKDEQIDAVIKSPELQEELQRSIEQAAKVKTAFQDVVDNTRQSFNDRYTALLGPHAGTTVDSVPIGKQFEALAQGTGQHELTPTFRGFLQRKGLELSRPTDFPVNGPEISGKPWRQLTPEMQRKYIAQGVLGPEAKASLEKGSSLSIQDLRDLRTELRENLPSTATNLDKKAYQQITQQITDLEQKTLTSAGATPEQIGGLRALDDEYGRFAETVRSLDPRSEKFGTQVANALFNPMAKDSGVAMNFIKLAQETDAAKPGTMEALRGAFMDRAITEAHVPDQPMQELKLLRKLQDRWGGDKESRAVMGAMFGKDSPLADPAQFTKVVEAGANPEPLILKAQQNWGRNIMHSPYFQGMIMYGAWTGMLGVASKGGIFTALTGQKGAEAQALAVTAMLAGPPMINWVARSGNSPLQRAMVSYLTNPSAPNAVRFAGEIGGATAGALSTQR
jgi:hypothetical protein